MKLDIFKALKGKNLHPRVLYPARFSFRIGEIKNFSEKQKLKEHINTKYALKEILKRSSVIRKEARNYGKEKNTIGKGNT